MTLPPDAPTADIAIIGAGLAGLSAARALTARGLSVRLFDKGRGPGGRLSTRRAGDWRFDHGGQYLTVRDDGFRAVMADLVAAGHAARWDGHVVRLFADGWTEPHRVERHVGTPGMNGVIQGLIAALPTAARPLFGAQVAVIAGGPGRWRLTARDGADLGCFARIVLAVPAPQAVDLLRPVAPALADRAAAATMAPCWALMLGFDAVPSPGWDAALLADAGGEERPLSWIAHDGGKPGRNGGASFVAHAAPAWSVRHLEESPEQVAPALLAAFRSATGIGGGEPSHLAAHRWRHALPLTPLADGFLWDAALGVGACGDWCLAARAEAAFVSGARLSAMLEA